MDAVPAVVGKLGSQRLSGCRDRILDDPALDGLDGPPSGPSREPLRVIVETTAPVVIKAKIAPDRKLCPVLLVSGREDPEWTHAFESLLESMGAEVRRPKSSSGIGFLLKDFSPEAAFFSPAPSSYDASCLSHLFEAHGFSKTRLAAVSDEPRPQLRSCGFSACFVRPLDIERLRAFLLGSSFSWRA